MVKGTDAGLDRKDCKIGYVPGNVVPCCTRCNLVKRNEFSYEEFMEIAPAIRRIDQMRLENSQAA